MTIYNDPQKYSKQTSTSIEQAELRCSLFKQIQQKVHEARKCPKCSKHTLTLEEGNYEEGYSDYIYCENDKIVVIDDGEECTTDCGFTSEALKEFELLYHWHDFDEVLAFSLDNEDRGIEAERKLGCSWADFVDKSNQVLVANA